MKNNDTIDLKEILNHFDTNFCQKDCTIETNYKKLETIQISFEKENLPHLLGLHKVVKGKSKRASTIISNIENGNMNIKSIRKHHNFNDIKPRIYNYYKIEKIMINPKSEVCILEKDLKNNTMGLNIVLLEPSYKKEYMILGLKRNNKTGIYYPATYFKQNSSKYREARMTQIKNITWV